MNANHRYWRRMHSGFWRSARIILSIAAVFIGEHLVPVETAEGADADYVIRIVFDGFRSDAISAMGPNGLHNVYRMINEGAWTNNSRKDYDFTETLPDHTDMLTSRPVTGSLGHGVSFNVDNGSTIHEAAGSYVTSVFDVVHDNGMRTGLYASKSKFVFFDRSWNADNGRADTIGADNGRDKIDVYSYNDATSQLTNSFIAAMTENPFNYVMINLSDPDTAGHGAGWMSSNYREAVRKVDGYLGQILNMVENSPVLHGHTIVLLISDHGGTGYNHVTASDLKNYRIPFLVWGAGVTVGGDLYAMNSESRAEPGDGRPDHKKTPQPIRNGDSGNLATQLLGLGTIDGSLFNSNHDLSVRKSSSIPLQHHSAE
jgi:predicted AlkP superfamily pyrophosphatase or phosphodiesterase